MSRRSVLRANTYILMWGGDNPFTVTSLGQPVVLPPHDQVAVGREGRYRFSSAVDSDGQPIPGTVVLTDEMSQPGTGQVLSLDARRWVDMLETNQPKLFESGFEIVDTPDLVEEKRAAVREAYEIAQDKAADDVIRAELARREKWETKGQPAPPPQNANEIQWAMDLKKRNRTRNAQKLAPRADLLAALGDNVLGVGTPAPEATPKSEPDPVTTPPRGRPRGRPRAAA